MVESVRPVKSRVAGWITTPQIRSAAFVAGELILLAVWTLFVTRPYLTSDPYVVPFGRDLVVSTIGHNMWVHTRECGLCALWNGDIRGGTPALVDPLGATLNPLVAISTYWFGYINGAKAVLVVSFFLTGVGQWAIARVLGAGRLARLWCGAMAIAAGHLAGAMSTGGLVPVVTSLASATMLLAALLALTKRESRRLRVVAGVLVAMLIVSGQGYIQLAFALALPLFAIFLAGARDRARMFIRDVALAGLLGVLLASPFLAPYLSFYPRSTKELTTTFDSAQPFQYAVLNLVINDWGFFTTEVLGKFAIPEWYIIFVGWPALILAFTGLVLLWSRGEKTAGSVPGNLPDDDVVVERRGTVQVDGRAARPEPGIGPVRKRSPLGVADV